MNPRHARIVPGLLLALLVGCGEETSPTPPEPPIDISAETALHESIGAEASARFDELASDMDRRVAIAALAGEMEARSDVENVGVAADSNSVWWTVVDGFDHLFSTNTNFIARTAGAPRHRTTAPPRETQAPGRDLPDSRAALLLSPFAHELVDRGLPRPFPTLANELSGAGYPATLKQKLSVASTDIEITDFLGWDAYGVNGVLTHGGFYRGDFYFVTGVLASNLPAAYNGAVASGQLLQHHVEGHPEMFVSVGPAWFQARNGNLARTLVYVGGCSARGNTTLSSVLTGTGSAFFGWDAKVAASQAHTTSLDLFAQLLDNRLDCDDALAAVDANGNASAQTDEGPSTFGFDGDGSLRLVPAWEIEGTNPRDGQESVPVTTLIAATANSDLDPATVTTSSVSISGVGFVVAYAERTIVITPSTDLAWETDYLVTIGTGVTDTDGNPLEEPFTWSFTTAGEPAPSCVSVRTGGWEFCVIAQGNCALHFTGGGLRQDECFVSYDDDNFFAGPLSGSRWSGENNVEMFRFDGSFLGQAYDRFDGTLTLTDGSGLSAELIGQFGTLPRHAAHAQRTRAGAGALAEAIRAGAR